MVIGKRGRGGLFCNKRAQFFIIAAVLIAAAVIGLVVTKNYFNPGQGAVKFYDLSSEIKAESNRVIDYGVVYNVDQLPSFTEKISQNLYDVDPGTQFIFIYGDKTRLVVENYGLTGVTVDGQNVAPGGATTESNVGACIGSNCFSKQVVQKRTTFKPDWRKVINPGSDTVIVTAGGQDYSFDITGGQQFYMIITKTTEGGQFVDVS